MMRKVSFLEAVKRLNRKVELSKMKAKAKKLHGVKIGSRKDLPCWFDLATYRELRKMDLDGWFFQLAVRAAAFDSASSWRSDSSKHKELNVHWDLDPRLKRKMVELPKNDWASTALLRLIAEDPILTSARIEKLPRLIREMLTRYFELGTRFLPRHRWAYIQQPWKSFT
jgi:hypothetical protein